VISVPDVAVYTGKEEDEVDEEDVVGEDEVDEDDVVGEDEVDEDDEVGEDEVDEDEVGEEDVVGEDEEESFREEAGVRDSGKEKGEEEEESFREEAGVRDSGKEKGEEEEEETELVEELEESLEELEVDDLTMSQIIIPRTIIPTDTANICFQYFCKNTNNFDLFCVDCIDCDCGCDCDCCFDCIDCGCGCDCDCCFDCFCDCDCCFDCCDCVCREEPIFLFKTHIFLIILWMDDYLRREIQLHFGVELFLFELAARFDVERDIS
jgi:hypothetical protein